MPRYVAFLRAINVGGASTVKMDVLRRIFEDLGFSNVASYIASGNLVFETASRDTVALERKIEKGLIQALGYEATPFIRTGEELKQIAAFKAFPVSSFHKGDQLAVVLLSTPPKAKVKSALEAFPSGTDEFRLRGREIHWLRHRTAEGAVYSTVPLDKVIDQPFTIRSLGTVQKIVERYFS